ncbi:MAG: HAD-IC family P-type ATPase [Burkholderiaceae bacterium]
MQPTETAWHALEPDAALQRLGSNVADGLSDAQARERAAAQGPNALPEPPRASAWRLFARQLASPLVLILFVAALLAVVLGHLGDAAVILAVVVVNALVGSAQEGRAERSMRSLRRLAALQVGVLRDGQEQRIAARELVCGDLLLLAAGDAVAADARLVQASRLQVAEAALTGESVPVAKAVAAMPAAAALADRHNMVYSGTFVTAGRARAVVVAIGAHTEVGRIARLTEQAVEPLTPLQRRLERFGRALVAAALVLFVAVVALGLLRELPLADVLMVAISQMVSMVPEGLPVAMTIALAVGMQRMSGRGAIIRRLAAVETLGSTTVICTDKTGTLTCNEMTAVALWLPATSAAAARALTDSGRGYAPEGELRHDGRPAPPDDALRALLGAAVLCNDAELLPPDDALAAWRVIGDPTEGALLVAAGKAGLDVAALRRHWPREDELPFDAERRVMVTRHRDAAGAACVIVKGAPEALLPLCAHGADAAAARAEADAMAARALRVLALARVDEPIAWRGEADALPALAGRLRLLGLVGEIDPPREAARDAVAACRAAGIRPIMVTGDHRLTGLAIARELGIAAEHDVAVDGAELERLAEPELDDALEHIAVFARVQPAQKLRIVQALQRRGEVVAMTGDGVNDAPALALADVGVAMGRSGTEVAKSAARVVITDDDFATLVGAVEQGRVVYANLKKVILFLFATSLDEVLLLLAALLAGLPLPLAAVQILWINIVTEGTLTINLVMEPPEGDEMRRAPVPRDDALLDATMRRRIALMALATVAVCGSWYALRYRAGVPLPQLRTEVFTMIAVCQWFNVLNCQSALRSALRFGVLRNRWLLGGLGASVALQLAVLYLPALNALFYTVPLAPSLLAAIVALASLVLWAEELRKALARQRISARRRTPAAPRPDPPAPYPPT